MQSLQHNNNTSLTTCVQHLQCPTHHILLCSQIKYNKNDVSLLITGSR